MNERYDAGASRDLGDLDFARYQSSVTKLEKSAAQQCEIWIRIETADKDRRTDGK